MDLFDSWWKVLILAVIIIVLFGSRKLPGAARSLGQSVRILKTEMRGLHDDDESEPESGSAPAPQAAPAQLQAPAPAPAAPAPDTQTQIEALSKQLADLQQSVKTSDGAQAK